MKVILKADPGTKQITYLEISIENHLHSNHKSSSQKKRWLGAKPPCGVHLPFGFGSHEELNWPLAKDWNKVLPSNASVLLSDCLVLAWTRPPAACRELCGSSQICSWKTQNCIWEWGSTELKPSTLVARLLGRSSLFVWCGTGFWITWAHFVHMAAQWRQEGKSWHHSIIYYLT